MWTVLIRDQTASSVQSDLDLHCPQKLLVLSLVRKELTQTVPKKQNFEYKMRKKNDKELFLLCPTAFSSSLFVYFFQNTNIKTSPN